MNSIVKTFGGVLGTMKEESEAQKAQREMVLGEAKGNAVVEGRSTNAKSSKDQQEAYIKRSTELGQMYANVMKTGSFDPETVKNDPTLAGLASIFDKGKLQPEQMMQFGNIINKERLFLNTRIEDQSNPCRLR